MTSVKNVHQRVHAVMLELDFVAKGDKTVNNQYRFVSHDDVTAAVRVPALKHGLVIYQNVVVHEVSGNTTAVTTEINIVNVDNPDDRIVVKSFGYGVDPQDKGPGKAMSYAFKYGLLKAFCLETGDDPEKDLIERKPADGKPFAPAFKMGGK